MGNLPVLISIAIWLTCVATHSSARSASTETVRRRYGADWQQFFGGYDERSEHNDNDDVDGDYGDYNGHELHNTYLQLLSGELPADSATMNFISRNDDNDNEEDSGELNVVDGTPEDRPPPAGGVAPPPPPDQPCIDGTYYPSASNCSALHVCRRRHLTEVACPADMWFDPAHRDDILCQYPEVICAADNTVCDCAAEYPPLPADPLLEPQVSCRADQRFHYAASEVACGRYFVCFNERVQRRECRAGLHWNAETEQCDYPELVNCLLRDAECPAEGVKFLPHAEHEDAFWFCVLGHKTLQTCPFYHVWNAETEACEARVAEAQRPPHFNVVGN